RNDAQHRGIPRRADRRRVARGHVFRDRYQPVALDPGEAGAAAMMILADAPAIKDHSVTRLDQPMAGRDHGSGKIDARDQRKLPDDRRPPGDREAILVIDGRMLDGDGYIARHEIIFAEGHEIERLTLVGLADQNGAKLTTHETPLLAKLYRGKRFHESNGLATGWTHDL